MPARAQQCPVSSLKDAVRLIKNAPGCQPGIALYKSCGGAASSYTNLRVLAVEAQKRCEAIFLKDLHGHTRRLYKSREKRCYDKSVPTPLFYQPRSLCGPYLAHDYARRYIILKEQMAKNPDPPL